MSDDAWRRRSADDEDDFGPPLFDDSGETESRGLTFGDADTGSLPHWTEPPTGEIPRSLSPEESSDPTDDLDVWSSFSGQQPQWRDDAASDPSGGLDDITGLSPVFEDTEPPAFAETAPSRDDSAPVRREQGRITIGTDPTDGAASRPTPSGRRPRPGDSSRGRGGRPSTQVRAGTGRPQKGASARDMPTAIAVGLAIAVVFVVALLWKPIAVAAIVVLVLGLAAVEYFDRVREKGYNPAFIPGIATCVAAPLAVYNYGTGALPLVVVLAFVACAVSFIGAPSLDSNPMPNTAISMMGITWIGVLGAFGAAIVALSNVPLFVAEGFVSKSVGTDTLCLLAIGVVANDVGALFVGSSVGRTPLRHWISPNKSFEGLVGGTLLTMGVMFVIGMRDVSTTWNSTGDLLLLGLVISVMAPIGDLTESMFKRNLDVKDFGSIVKGHGGILDRFDAFLFVMPAVFYLTITLQPWVTK